MLNLKRQDGGCGPAVFLFLLGGIYILHTIYPYPPFCVPVLTSPKPDSSAQVSRALRQSSLVSKHLPANAGGSVAKKPFCLGFDCILCSDSGCIVVIRGCNAQSSEVSAPQRVIIREGRVWMASADDDEGDTCSSEEVMEAVKIRIKLAGQS